MDSFSMALIFYLGVMMLTPTSKSISPVYNQTCKRPEDCGRPETYLNCVYRKCICDSHNYYDGGMCKVKFPSQCKIQRNRWEAVQPCVSNAHCAYPLDTSGNELRNAVQGTCQCLINRSPKPDGTCNAAMSISNYSSAGYFIIVSWSILFMMGWTYER